MLNVLWGCSNSLTDNDLNFLTEAKELMLNGRFTEALDILKVERTKNSLSLDTKFKLDLLTNLLYVRQGEYKKAIEEIEKFRLCSYTEKSQRYIKLEDEFIIPEEVKKAQKEDLFINTIRAQNRLYPILYEKLRPYVFETNKDLAENPKNHSMLDGWAKEDARYTVCLAMEGQLGLTLNARNLEFLIRRFSSKP